MSALTLEIEWVDQAHAGPGEVLPIIGHYRRVEAQRGGRNVTIHETWAPVRPSILI